MSCNPEMNDFQTELYVKHQSVFVCSMQYATVDPALLATYAATDRYQLVTSQPLAAAAGVPLSAARYAVPAVASGVTYTAAG